MEYNNEDFEDLLGVTVDLPTNEDEPPVDPPTPPTEEPKEPDEIAISYFEILKENELLDLPEDFEFDGTPEKVKEALEITRVRTKEQSKSEVLAQVSPEMRAVIEYALEGGQSLDKFINAHQDIDYDALDLDDEAHQRYILFEYYKKTSNYSPEKINKIIDRLSPDDLADEALETREELKQLAIEQKANVIQQAKAEKAAREAEAKKQTDKLTKLIEESPNLDATRKGRLKTFMFVPVNDGETYSTQLAKTMNQVTTNPEHLIQLADILADYNPKTGFTLDRIKKQLKTETNQTFKEYLHSKVDPKTQMKGGAQQKPANDVDWEKYFQY